MVVHILLLIILLVINLLPEYWIDRKKYVLPFSFILILIYWSIRYDYGLDYWNYYNAFYSGVTENARGTRETWFYAFFGWFDYYYQAVIAESVIIAVTFFYFARKYVSTQFYWLFFLLLFSVPGLHFNLISAMRSTMAACVLYWAFDLCYISKRRWLLYIVLVLVASQFHTSALAFVVLPLVHYAFNKAHGMVVFLVLVLFDILQMFFANSIYNWIITLSVLTADYDNYSAVVQSANINGFIVRSAILYPTFFICNYYDKIRTVDTFYRQVFILAFFYLAVAMIGLNFQGRFTVYLFPFFMLALANTCNNVDKNKKWVILLPYFIILLLGFIGYYNALLDNINGHWSEGNPYYYHTIFEAPSLP